MGRDDGKYFGRRQGNLNGQGTRKTVLPTSPNESHEGERGVEGESEREFIGKKVARPTCGGPIPCLVTTEDPNRHAR